jgi:hypothetical protein
VRTKDLCWSVGTIYNPRELPKVSTAGFRSGRGVTHRMNQDSQVLYQAWDAQAYLTEAGAPKSISMARYTLLGP